MIYVQQTAASSRPGITAAAKRCVGGHDAAGPSRQRATVLDGASRTRSRFRPPRAGARCTGARPLLSARGAGP
jgi:hypothetical protein